MPRLVPDGVTWLIYAQLALWGYFLYGFGLAPFLLGALADGVGAHLAVLLVPLFLAAAALLVVRLGRQLTVFARA